MRKMTELEQDFLTIAHDICAMVFGARYPILGIKINAMANYRGWAIPDDTNEGFHILLSTMANQSPKEFTATLAHELIHIHLWHGSPKHQAKAHKHGRLFRRVAKKIAACSNGYLTAKDIV